MWNGGNGGCGLWVVGWWEGVGGCLAVVDGRWSWWFGRLGMEAGVFFQSTATRKYAQVGEVQRRVWQY